MFKKHHQARCCFSVSVLLPLAVALGDYGGRQEPTEGPGLKNKSTAEVPKTVVLLMPVWGGLCQRARGWRRKEQIHLWYAINQVSLCKFSLEIRLGGRRYEKSDIVYQRTPPWLVCNMDYLCCLSANAFSLFIQWIYSQFTQQPLLKPGAFCSHIKNRWITTEGLPVHLLHKWSREKLNSQEWQLSS